jgi:hypothetical protein
MALVSCGSRHEIQIWGNSIITFEGDQVATVSKWELWAAASRDARPREASGGGCCFEMKKNFRKGHLWKELSWVPLAKHLTCQAKIYALEMHF